MGKRSVEINIIEAASPGDFPNFSQRTNALATDYDVWKEGEEVNVEKVLETMARNIENAKKMLKRVIETIKPEDIENSPAKTALVGAIQTKPEFISEEVKKRLWLLLKDRI